MDSFLRVPPEAIINCAVQLCDTCRLPEAICMCPATEQEIVQRHSNLFASEIIRGKTYNPRHLPVVATKGD